MREYARPSRSERGKDADLVGASLPLGPGEDVEAAVLAHGDPAAVHEGGPELRRQRDPAFRVELVAMRAEQFGHASSPFLH